MPAPSRDEKALETRLHWRAWLGLYLQPVLIVAVALPFGLLTAPEPPDSVALVIALVCVTLASLVPVLADTVRQHRELAPLAAKVRRKGGKAPGLAGRLGWRLVSWLFLQGVAAVVGVLLLQLVGADDWAQVAIIPLALSLVATVPTLIGLLVYVAVAGAVLVKRAVAGQEEPAEAIGSEPETRASTPPGTRFVTRLVMGATGVLLVSLAVGAPAFGAKPGPVHRGVGSLVGLAGWAFTGEGRPLWIWWARVTVVVIGLCFTVIVPGSAWLVATAVRSARADRDPKDALKDTAV